MLLYLTLLINSYITIFSMHLSSQVTEFITNNQSLFEVVQSQYF